MLLRRTQEVRAGGGMSIHVKRTGSTWSWVRLALFAAFVVAALATGYFGLQP